MLDRILIFLFCESLPSEDSMDLSPATTFSSVSGSENRLICFLLAMSSSATVPVSPSLIHICSTFSTGLPEVDAMDWSMSLSAMPSFSG